MHDTLTFSKPQNKPSAKHSFVNQLEIKSQSNAYKQILIVIPDFFRVYGQNNAKYDF